MLAKIPALIISSELPKGQKVELGIISPLQPYPKTFLLGWVFITRLKNLSHEESSVSVRRAETFREFCGPCNHLVWDSPSRWCKHGAGRDSELLTEFCFQSWVCLSDSKGCWATWTGAKENVDANPAKQTYPPPAVTCHLIVLHSISCNGPNPSACQAMWLVWQHGNPSGLLSISGSRLPNASCCNF